MQHSDWISVKERLPEIPEGRFAVSVIVATYDPMYADFLRRDGSTDPKDGMSTFYGSFGYTKYIDHPNNMGLRVGHKVGEPISSWFKDWPTDKDFISSVSGPNGDEPSPFWDEVTHWMYFPEPPDAPTK